MSEQLVPRGGNVWGGDGTGKSWRPAGGNHSGEVWRVCSLTPQAALSLNHIYGGKNKVLRLLPRATMSPSAIIK